MPKDIHVLMIEDDPFARDLMGMLLTRDWRTRIVSEVGSEDDLQRALDIPYQRIDATVLDTEVPGDANWPFKAAEITLGKNPATKILCTATRSEPGILKRVLDLGFGGYVVKKEMGYSLAAAVALVVKSGRFVLTESSYRLALRERLALPEEAVVLDGNRPVANLTPREEEIARLAILFNHPHRDLSDELLIRADQVSKHVSNVYSKLGLDQIIEGELAPDVFFQDKLVLKHFRRILGKVSRQSSRRKTADMATLAFHLLTQPEVRELL
jgi:two-component system response regulator FimZ (fimbrial Z protein)